MPKRILIVDDEASIVESLSLILRHANYSVDFCYDGVTALKMFDEGYYDLILLDIKMPKMDGMEVLENIMSINRDQLVIMISGHGNIETAVKKTKKGAYYFLEKPLPDVSELLIIIKNALELKQSKDELSKYKNELLSANQIIGVSKDVQSVKYLIEKYKDLDLNILITGESGTGKLLVANMLHFTSKRANQPFVIINCASLKGENVDEELFGLVQDGNPKIKGKLEEAEGGSILFDEISNINTEIQSKLLKVIDESKYTRVGDSKVRKTNVRFLFTTNKDLSFEISEGRFRDDFYHRINVMNINITPLRERTDDIEVLTEYFINQICKAYNISLRKFSTGALKKLVSFRWTGNVRELKNFIERIIFTVESAVIEEEDIDIPETKHTKELTDLLNRNLSLNEFQNESEKIFLLKVLKDYKYNISQTAEGLKIQRSHMYKLMTKYNIPTPTKTK